jgi:hypothetical protein
MASRNDASLTPQGSWMGSENGYPRTQRQLRNRTEIQAGTDIIQSPAV